MQFHILCWSFCLVPIYDVRQTKFSFNAEAFNTLSSLPTFDGDLPPNSIVAVGYTVNSFAYAPQNSAPKNDTAIFLNVLFLMYLGELPEEEEEEWILYPVDQP